SRRRPAWCSPRSGRLAAAGENPGRGRQFRRGKRKRFAPHLGRPPVELEHDPPRLDPADPMLGRALAAAHAHFGGFGRDRHIGEDADPHPADTADIAGGGPPAPPPPPGPGPPPPPTPSR